LKIKKTYISSFFVIFFTILTFQSIYHFLIAPLQKFQDVIDVEVKVTCNLGTKIQILQSSVCHDYLAFMTRTIKLHLNKNYQIDESRVEVIQPFSKINFIFFGKYNNDEFGLKNILSERSLSYVDQLKDKVISKLNYETKVIEHNIIIYSILKLYSNDNPELKKFFSRDKIGLIDALKRVKTNNLEKIEYYKSMDVINAFNYELNYTDLKILENNKFNTLNYLNIFVISFIFGFFINILILIVRDLIRSKKESLEV